MDKLLLLILDGAADSLNEKTSLDKARTQNLDWLARNGKTGLIYPVEKGIAPQSDVAIAALLGNDPNTYAGRGPLEALGTGIKIEPGDLALRANFATVENNKIIDRRAGRTLTTKEGDLLAEDINKNVKLECPFEFIHTTAHRAVLVLRGSFSPQITNTDPAYKKVKNQKYGTAAKIKDSGTKKCKPLEDTKKAEKTAYIINDFIKQSKNILRNHKINEKREENTQLPANFITTRDAGNQLPEFTNLTKKYNQRWASIVGMPLEKGITQLAGMRILEFEYDELKEPDKYTQTENDLNKEITQTKAYLKKEWNNFDAFYLHIKQPDIPGHDGNQEEKVRILEKIDKELIRFLRNKKATIVVTCDHATPCSLKRHSDDPVPLLIYDKDQDHVKRFTEKACTKGSIGQIQGRELMDIIHVKDS